MSLVFDVVIDTPEYSVDMKTGLETLQGVSDATRCIGEAILTERVPRRQSHKSKVRTNLRNSFKGSYGHVYSLNFDDEELKKKLRSITRPVFCELISYFISESLYQEPIELSQKAQNFLDKKIGERSEQIIEQLRLSSLENIHKVSKVFNHKVKIRFRKNRDHQTVLARFDRNTAKVLEATEGTDVIEFEAAITRLNIFTGNGRLLINGEAETTAFGFDRHYRQLARLAKQRFSENLNHNNGLDSERYEYIAMKARAIKLQNNKVVKYILTDITDD